MKKKGLKKKQNKKVWNSGLKDKLVNIASETMQRKGLILT